MWEQLCGTKLAGLMLKEHGDGRFTQDVTAAIISSRLYENGGNVMFEIETDGGWSMVVNTKYHGVRSTPEGLEICGTFAGADRWTVLSRALEREEP